MKCFDGKKTYIMTGRIYMHDGDDSSFVARKIT